MQSKHKLESNFVDDSPLDILLKEINMKPSMNGCVKIKQTGNVTQVSCVLGLWSVCGRDKDRVMSDAMIFFEQYKRDGEYHKIIGGDSPRDILFDILLDERWDI